MTELAPEARCGRIMMQDRGAFKCLGGLLALTIVFFVFSSDERDQPATGIQAAGTPTVMINGRLFNPSFIAGGNTDSGRMVIVVDEADLFVGENTVEIHWDSAPSAMTAKLPSGLQQH